jgi:peptidoglycan/xylan/chitin deacetylase (PgdA/CDA1 family)
MRPEREDRSHLVGALGRLAPQAFVRAFAGSLVAVFLLVWSAACAAAGTQAVKVVLRFDDYCATSDTEQEIRLLNGIVDRGLPITVAVIPMVATQREGRDAVPLSPEKANLLKPAISRGMVEVALHGLHHVSVRSDVSTEYQGRPLADQVAVIKRGKELLEARFATPVTTFIPPWNSYDENTLVALQQTGFRTIAASRRGTVLGGKSLKFVPFSVNGPARLAEAVQAARNSDDKAALVVVMLHLYDFKAATRLGVQEKIDRFLLELDALKASGDIEFHSVASIAGEPGYAVGGQGAAPALLAASRAAPHLNPGLSSERLDRGRLEFWAHRLVPWLPGQASSELLYADAPRLWLPVFAMGLHFVAGSAALMLLGMWLSRRLTWHHHAARWPLVTVALLLLLLAGRMWLQDQGRGFGRGTWAPFVFAAALGIALGGSRVGKGPSRAAAPPSAA